MISAGRVLLMPKGDYDPTATYEMLDIVSYNGSSYIAKSTTTGNLPTNTTYWQLSAYGGQAANLAGNFAPLETTEYAIRAYAIDDIFVDKDSQLVIATTTINIGDEIEIGSNCNTTTMAELLDAIENRYDALDQRNRKLVGINPITIQTDLHLLAPGEYFKKLTNFYVTNAPTGINQVPTAIFRLTVESGLDESGSSLLLTLRTIEGEIYTQAYDGSIWSDWRKAGDVDSSNLGTAAAKDSTNAVTQNSTDLVESGAVYTAIDTLSGKAYKTDDTTENTLASDDVLPFYDTSATAQRKMSVEKFVGQTVSNPNLLDNPWFTVNQRGASTVSNAYGVDRWRGVYDVDANGLIDLSPSHYIIQLLEPSLKEYLNGKTVTVSILFSDGTIETGTGVYNKAPSSVLTIVDSTHLVCQISTGGDFTITARSTISSDDIFRAVKLELGSVSTLAMDTAPNYATELLKCQRYFVRDANTGTGSRWINAIGINQQRGVIQMFKTLPVTMRTTPSISFSGELRSWSPSTVVTSIDAVHMIGNTLHMSVHQADATVNDSLAHILFLNGVGYIDFSAEL